MKHTLRFAALGLGIGCAVGVAIGIDRAQAQMQGQSPATSARWVCKEAGTGDTANAALKDGSAQLVCREVYVTVKTASGKTMVIGNPTSKSGTPNKASTYDMSKAADARAASDAAADILAEITGTAGGG